MVLGDQLVDEFSEDEEIIIETRPTTPEQQQPEQEIPLSVLAAESMLEDVPSSPGIEKVDPNTRPQDFNEMDADIEEAEMERRMETDEQRERLEAEQDDVITREAENHARSFPVSNQDSLSSLAANNPTDS